MTIDIGARLSGGRARVAIASLPQPAHHRPHGSITGLVEAAQAGYKGDGCGPV
jgi:hypothetical protein